MTDKHDNTTPQQAINIRRLQRASRPYRLFIWLDDFDNAKPGGWREVGVLQWFTTREFVKHSIRLGHVIADGPVSAKVRRCA